MTKKRYYQLWKDYEELVLQKKYNESYFDYSEEEYRKARKNLIDFLRTAESNLLIELLRKGRYAKTQIEVCEKLLHIVEYEECVNAEDYNDTYGLLTPRWFGIYTTEQILALGCVITALIIISLIVGLPF